LIREAAFDLGILIEGRLIAGRRAYLGAGALLLSQENLLLDELALLLQRLLDQRLLQSLLLLQPRGRRGRWRRRRRRLILGRR